MTGTRIGRYRAVSLRSAVGSRFPMSISAVCGRFKEKSTVGSRLRKKKERRRRGKEEEEEEEGENVVVARKSPVSRRRPCRPRVIFLPTLGDGFRLPTWERVRGD
ncbi:hypothetical protein BHE74_00051423, partial [Ensete ventricosum]